jgi:hypothetical protein
MFRIPLLSAGLLLSLNVAALACSSTSCPPTKIKPPDIKQFMREQAASTRGKALNRETQAATKPISKLRLAKQKQMPGVYHSAKQRVGRSDRHLGKTYSAANRFRHQPPEIFASRPKPKAAAGGDAAFAPPKFSVVEVVSDEQFNAIDQTVAAFDIAPPATSQSARLIVADAFAEIERKPKGSLEADDLLAANERAKAPQPSWLRWIWSAIGTTLSSPR